MTYIFTLLHVDQYDTLLTLESAFARTEYVRTLAPRLGTDHLPSYDYTKVYVSDDGFSYRPLTAEEYLAKHLQPDFAEGFRAIADIEGLPDFLTGFGLKEDTLDLYMLVLCKTFELGLDAEDMELVTSLGGTREPTPYPNPHRVIKTLLVRADDPACLGREITNGYCSIEYDALLLGKSYEELLAGGHYVEFYAKSALKSHEDASILRGRMCFLNRVADHLADPNIRRVFAEETGQLSPRAVNPEEGDFRRYLVGRLRGPGDGNTCAEELLVKLAGGGEHSIEAYQAEMQSFYQEAIEFVAKWQTETLSKYSELLSLQEQLTDPTRVEKHLRVLRLLDAAYNVDEYWESMYDNTGSAGLKAEMDAVGGRDVSQVYTTSLYPVTSDHNIVADDYHRSVEGYLRLRQRLAFTLIRRKRLFNDVSTAEISGVLAAQGLLFDKLGPLDEVAKGIGSSFTNALVNCSGDEQVAKVVAAYTALDKRFIANVSEARVEAIQAMIDKLETIRFSRLAKEDIASNKGWGIKIRLNPIKVPKPSDIARELGGVLDSAGNVIGGTGATIVNIFEEVRRTGEELLAAVGAETSKLEVFVREELAELEKYMRRDFGSDLDEAVNNIIIKPINWVFCGGRQPPDEGTEDDGCVEGGLECTKGSDGTQCRLTDAEGNPSDVPVDAGALITEEQLQWLRDVELQDMINSMDFADALGSWMSRSAHTRALQALLSRRQSDLSERLSNVDGLDLREHVQLAQDLDAYKKIVELISSGARAGAANIIQTVKNLLDIAQTAEDLEATIDFVTENGVGPLIASIRDATVAYWDEFVGADAEGRAQVIGIVTSDVIMALVPAGTLARLGKETVRLASASSGARRLTQFVTESANGLLGRVSGDKLGALMGQLRVAGRTRGNTLDFRPGSRKEAEFLAKCWVGPNPTRSDYLGQPGKFVYTSRDRTKLYREPAKKKGDNKVKANYEWRSDPNAGWEGQAHMEIVD